MLTEEETALLAAVFVAHDKMGEFEMAAKILENNIRTVSERAKDGDGDGYLSEILRAGRQATVVTELSREAHDAVVGVLQKSGLKSIF